MNLENPDLYQFMDDTSELEKYFRIIRDDYEGIDEDIRSILAAYRSPETAVCMVDIKKAYKELTECAFLIKDSPSIICRFLLSIPHVATYSNENGTLFFYLIE
ncbi:hypothetical protein GQX74_008456 [Glossina fuscipes]|nr:hypothetical protein GQX74_008456 [Glossina fuscipes]